jgi:hypothetical protein
LLEAHYKFFNAKWHDFQVSLFRKPQKKNTPQCFYFILLGGGGLVMLSIQTQGTGRLPDATLKNVDHTNITNNAVVIIVTLIFFR